jgi:hypothetical protein
VKLSLSASEAGRQSTLQGSGLGQQDDVNFVSGRSALDINCTMGFTPSGDPLYLNVLSRCLDSA